jgi:hypothetical protein
MEKSRMSNAQHIIERILTGDLSQRAQGFMLVLPRGYQLEGLLEAAIEQAYGSRGHPDIRRLAPEGAGNMIKVDAMRDVQGFLASTASSSDMKTLVVYRADRMNPSAANALLKPLEEPTKSTRIIILTDNPDPLPTTIRSRCSVYTVSPDKSLALQEFEALVSSEDIQTKEKPDTLLDLADGNPALAADIARHGLSSWIKKVETWISGNDPTPPLPTLTGKSGVPLLTAVTSLQAMLVRAARGEITLKGWSLENVIEASWAVIQNSTDITRAGIDAKTRLHTILLNLREANSAQTQMKI